MLQIQGNLVKLELVDHVKEMKVGVMEFLFVLMTMNVLLEMKVLYVQMTQNVLTV
jgi:hypothetical protein